MTPVDAKLAATLIAEDAAEDNGLHVNDRTTCHTCQAWATPEHRDSAEHKAAIGIHPDFVYDGREGVYRAPARGRGRPRVGTRVHVILPEDQLAAVDQIASDAEMSRSDVLRELIAGALKVRSAP